MSAISVKLAKKAKIHIACKLFPLVCIVMVSSNQSFGVYTDQSGSYQQYVTSPARYITLIPDGVSDYVAGPVMCSAATIYSSIKTAALKPGNWAVFPGGGGGVGIQGVQLAAAMGLRAIVVDTGAEREKLTKSYGAEHFFDFRTCDPVAEVLKATDGGAHAVFVTAVQAYPIALKYLGNRRGGQVMCIGLPPTGEFHIDLDPTNLVFRNQSIKGTLVSSLGEIDETLAFAARGRDSRLVKNLTDILQVNFTSNQKLLASVNGMNIVKSSSDRRSPDEWLLTSISRDSSTHRITYYSSAFMNLLKVRHAVNEPVF